MIWTDAQDLAIAVLGLDDDADFGIVEQALCDRFEISFDAFAELVESLMPFTIPATAALTGESFHGFVKDGAFLCKTPVAD